MNRASLGRLDRASFIDGLAEKIEDSTQDLFADGDGDW